MRNKKKIIAVLAVLAAAALVCVLALAAQTGVCGDNLTWSLDDDGNMVITGTGPMADDVPWANITYAISTLSFVSGPPSTFTDLPATGTDLPATGITTVSDFAFFYCTGLTEVVFPDSLTDIGIYAFNGCGSLELAVIPESVTSIGDDAFGNCPSLTIRCKNRSAAWEYATANDIPVELIIENIVTLPDDLTTIGAQAFAGDASIDAVRIHAGVHDIAAGAFDPGVVIIAPAGSDAAQWAAANGYTLITE